MKTRNFVAKYLRKFCKSKVETDKKKEDKRGYVKHKGDLDGETRSRWYDRTFRTIFW